METLSFDQLPNEVNRLSKKLDSIERLLLERNEHTPTDQPDQLLTIQETAEFLSLTVPTIYSKVSKGQLPVMKRSKRLYFSRTELLEYLKAGRKKSNSEIASEANAFMSNCKKGLSNGK